jgi:signal transduction histidine kinase
VTGSKRLAEEVRHLSEAVVRGQEEERQRIALSLHDGAGQLLAALALKLDEVAAADRRAQSSSRFSEMRGLVLQLMEDLRRLSHDLRPSALDRLGLKDALRELGESMSSATLAVEVVIEPKSFVDPGGEVSVALFRVAQAALGNVVRHAQARRARLELRSAGGAAFLEVTDDGIGLDPGRAGAGGIGIIGMRERVNWLGGRFEIESSPGRGTRVRARIPLHEPRA